MYAWRFVVTGNRSFIDSILVLTLYRGGVLLLFFSGVDAKRMIHSVTESSAACPVRFSGFAPGDM